VLAKASDLIKKTEEVRDALDYGFTCRAPDSTCAELHIVIHHRKMHVFRRDVVRSGPNQKAVRLVHEFLYGSGCEVCRCSETLAIPRERLSIDRFSWALGRRQAWPVWEKGPQKILDATMVLRSPTVYRRGTSTMHSLIVNESSLEVFGNM
jgi:hypothetical protein